MIKQAQVDSTTLNEGYSDDEDTSTFNTTDNIQSSPYQMLFVLQVRESLLMTAMEVIESGDVQAAAAYGQVLNEVNEWVEMYRHRIKQSTMVTEQMTEGKQEMNNFTLDDR